MSKRKMPEAKSEPFEDTAEASAKAMEELQADLRRQLDEAGLDADDYQAEVQVITDRKDLFEANKVELVGRLVPKRRDD